MELWDAYDRELNKIEEMTLIRGERIPKGVFHLVCDILVKHMDESYLLMKRDERKHFGGMWEASAGGAALQNETPLDCAVRELREETGIDSRDLIELGRITTDDTVFVEFLCITNGDKDSIVLQDGETIAYRWVSRNELAAMKSSELVTKRMQQFMKELQA